MSRFTYTWWFYVKYYFPFMYGLLTIEFEADRNDLNLKSLKSEFYERTKEYFDENNIWYEEEYMQELLDVDMFREFCLVLTSMYDRYADNKCVIDLTKISLDIVEERKSKIMNI